VRDVEDAPLLLNSIDGLARAVLVELLSFVACFAAEDVTSVTRMELESLLLMFLPSCVQAPGESPCLVQHPRPHPHPHVLRVSLTLLFFVVKWTFFLGLCAAALSFGALLIPPAPFSFFLRSALLSPREVMENHQQEKVAFTILYQHIASTMPHSLQYFTSFSRFWTPPSSALPGGSTSSFSAFVASTSSLSATLLSHKARK
jgi:hypothetical protein